MLSRTIFAPRHAALRDEAASFLQREVVPYYRGWERAGIVPREFWGRAGAAGLLCREVPRAFGGVEGDFLDSVVIIEEVAKRRCTGFMLFLHSDIVSPYLIRLGSELQKRTHLQDCVSGDRLLAVAITEPHSGSDLTEIRTEATRAGTGYRLDGLKTHVSGGMNADLLVVAARTGAAGATGRGGLSLFLVPARSAGIERTALAKAGLPALDTAQIAFTACEIERAGLLGAEGMGFLYLVKMLTIERLVLAIAAQASCVAIIQELIGDCRSRTTRSGSTLDFQNTRFTLADLVAQSLANQALVDRCIIDHMRDNLSPSVTCAAKLRTTEVLRLAALAGVQLRGARGVGNGAGEAAAQDLLDACVQTIWGGTNEVMRDIIGRGLDQWK